MLLRVKRRVFDILSKWLISPPERIDTLDLERRPLVVAGFFRTASGIGRSAQLHAHELFQAGLDPICVDLSEIFGQVDIESEFPLSPMPPSKSGTLILHVNAPETRPALWRLRMFRNKGWSIVGFWHYELARLPKCWVGEQRWLSEIWTPSSFVASAVREIAVVPVSIHPHRIDKRYCSVESSSSLAVPSNDVLTVFSAADGKSSLERKNLFGGIDAFMSAFTDKESARMIIKTRNVSGEPLRLLTNLCKSDSRLVHINASLNQLEQWQLLDSCDVVLSLHRSEGYGLVIAEALALEKEVIATEYSGGDEFKKDVRFHPVRYTLGPVQSDKIYANSDSCAWAYPDHSHAVELLRKLYARHFQNERPDDSSL